MTSTLPVARTADFDLEQAALTAARVLAARLKITPRWQERLTPEARQLVEAVDALDRAVTG